MNPSAELASHAASSRTGLIDTISASAQLAGVRPGSVTAVRVHQHDGAWWFDAVVLDDGTHLWTDTDPILAGALTADMDAIAAWLDNSFLPPDTIYVRHDGTADNGFHA